MCLSSPGTASVHRSAKASIRLRAAAVAPALLAALAMSSPATAQDADSAPLAVPDLTVTAEDPLILLPPLGPPVSEAPLAVPPADRRRSAYRDRPAVAAPGLGPVPAADAVLRVARSVQAVERNAEFTAAAGGVGRNALHAIPVAVSYRNGGLVPVIDLGLSGLVPTITGVPGDVSAYAALAFPAWRAGLAGTLTFADRDRAAQVELSAAAGRVSGTLSVQHWQAHPAAAELRLALAAEVALATSPAGPQAALGVAAGRTGAVLFALPAAHVHYAGKPAWHLAAGVRPVLGYPSWLAHLMREKPDSTAVLRPEQGWLAWLGAGVGSIDVRAGLAHGLTAGPRAERRAAAVASRGLVLFGMAAETAWQTAAGPVTAAARAGANWDLRLVRWRLHADGEWQVGAAPPVTLLLGVRWVASREYYGVYADEDWTLAVFPDEPGAAVIAGVRWSPARGHRLRVVGGVNYLPAGDLTWGVGIEYARDVVRLTAP